MIKNQLEIKKLEYNLGSWLQIRVHCIWCYPSVESKSLMVSKSLVELKSLVDYKSLIVIVNVLHQWFWNQVGQFWDYDWDLETMLGWNYNFPMVVKSVVWSWNQYTWSWNQYRWLWNQWTWSQSDLYSTKSWNRTNGMKSTDRVEYHTLWCIGAYCEQVTFYHKAWCFFGKSKKDWNKQRVVRNIYIMSACMLDNYDIEHI